MKKTTNITVTARAAAAVVAMAALVLTACTAGSDDAGETIAQWKPGADGHAPIAFGIYTGRTQTRAGVPGDLSTMELHEGDLGKAGIGVFGYYTHRDTYNHLVHQPNFMHNQQVKWNDGQNTWTYEPLMYWPNEGDDNNTTGDKLSFFAYAPYITIDHSTGFADPLDTTVPSQSTATGITGTSRKDQAGDPLVHYVAALDPTQSVDLCWGTAGGDWNYQDIYHQTVERQEGMPLLDLTRMASYTARIPFTMRHALAKFNVQISADIDQNAALDANTRVYIRRVTFTGFQLRGTLNLNNTTAREPRWLDYRATSLLTAAPVVFNDGRRDGSEGHPAGSAANEENQGFNPDLVQVTSAEPGVTNTRRNLFASTTNPDAALMVIPDYAPFTMKIEYDIETADPKLVGHYLSDGSTAGKVVETSVTVTDIFENPETRIEPGKSYIIRLHLGMTSLKFSASVDAWED